eukprot:TRINITY_DN1316_c0_g2_i1.p1 TRINITY_DN1316_c0_g2~~TRINITY_DN1316_c0_g2_i1.p1  ORF type:complete len:386 (+),score=90.71 TRINITY_DN1316_c0_g2_i1:71-1228(+)
MDEDLVTKILIGAFMLRSVWKALRNPSVSNINAASSNLSKLSPVTPSQSATSTSNAIRAYATKSRFEEYDITLPSKGHLGFKIVPQQVAMIVERFGRYTDTLTPGFHFLIPVLDRIAYAHTLKEVAMEVPDQTAITQDNVTIHIDGVLYVKVTDPVQASYGVENPFYAVRQLAMTTMRSELGKMSLDQTFADREMLNTNIVLAINAAAHSWGLKCLRYEIRDIVPPESVLKAMEMQLAAERKKRAQILESEGIQMSQINIAEGEKKSAILRAEGEAASMLTKARATSESLSMVGEAINHTGGKDAVSFRLAEQYVDAFSGIAKESNTVVIPSDVGNVSSMIAKAMSVFQAVNQRPGQSAKIAADNAEAIGPAATDEDPSKFDIRS